MNAGDYNLYVGGGSINKAFRQVLKLKGRNGYQELHEALFDEARARSGQLVALPMDSATMVVAKELGLLACFARVAAISRDGGPVGAVFLDVFRQGRRPLSEQNVAMLYVVGPKGQGAPGGHGPTIADRGQFLEAVEELAVNAITAVGAYNELVATDAIDLPKIEVVQWCLVSGGVYRHPEASKRDVATATVEGMVKASADGEKSWPLVRFAYDEHVFEDAVASTVGKHKQQ